MTIKSLLDTDLYKLTMLMAIYHNYPNVNCEFAFKDRKLTVFKELSTEDQISFIENLNEEIDSLCSLSLSKDEIDYLRGLGFFKETFLSFLKNFKLNREDITVAIVDGDLSIRTNGSWVQTTLFEVPVLAIVSELNSEYKGFNQAIASQRLHDKCQYLYENAPEDFQFADFGTRRRASFKWQAKVIRYFMDNLPEGMLVGTSNLYFAKHFGIKPIGTMAHEYIMSFQQLPGVRLQDFQKEALQVWEDEYRGELGIALSDTVGFDNFLKDFDKYFANLFDGCRHDSGDPFEWCTKLIDHYKKLDINPKTKTAVFSDGLDFELAVKLCKTYSPFINTSFGIGTYLTNDGNITAPSIVMKTVKVAGYPVAKLSDSSGKEMCEDPEFLKYLKYLFNK